VKRTDALRTGMWRNKTYVELTSGTSHLLSRLAAVSYDTELRDSECEIRVFMQEHRGRSRTSAREVLQRAASGTVAI
jgi:hypothetical protein